MSYAPEFYAVQANTAVSALVQQNKSLLQTSQNQARTIRTLSERNSNLEAEVHLEKYNTEFVKAQGRKTREKNKGKAKKIKDLLAEKVQLQAENEDLKQKANSLTQQLRAVHFSYQVLSLEQHNLLKRIEEMQKVRIDYSFSPSYDTNLTFDDVAGDFEIRFKHCEFRARFMSHEVRRMHKGTFQDIARATAARVVVDMQEKIFSRLMQQYDQLTSK